MDKKSNILTMLGFFKKSGKVVSGDKAVNALLKKNQIYMLIMADDLSDNRKKYWSNIAKQIGIPMYCLSSKVELGLAIGLSPRAIIGIIDAEMAKALEKKM